MLAISGEVLATHADTAQQPAAARAVLLALLAVTPVVVVLLPGLAALALLGGRVHSPITRIAVLLSVSGAAGLLAFWVTFISPDAGHLVGWAVLGASVIALAAPGAWDAVVRPDVVTPIALAAAAAALYSGVAFLDGGLAHPTRAMFDRLWAVFDNRVPEQFAARLVDGKPVHGFVQTDWHFSDRPPLQTAMLVPQYGLFGDRDLGYQFGATALQSLFVVGAWSLLRSIGARVTATATALAMIVPTGVLFFNAVYVWPKLLAATFVLAAAALVFAPLSDATGRARDLRVLLVASTALLAMLAHGSSVYAILALAPFAVVRLRLVRNPGRAAIVVAVAFVVLYAPWSAFQKYEDPPGNRLAKWHLANVIDPKDRRSTLEAVVDQYSAAGIAGTIENKLDNFTTLFWRDDFARDAATWGWTGTRLGDARVLQLELLAPSVLPMALVALVLLTRRGRRLAPPLVTTGAWIGLTLLVWCLMQFGRLPPSRTVVHNGSLAPVVGIIALCALLAVRFGRHLAALAASAQIAVFAVVWVHGLQGHPANPTPTTLGHTDPAAAVIVLAAVVAIIAVLLVAHETDKRSVDSGDPDGWGELQPTR